MIEDLLTGYAEFVDIGTINYLITLMGEKEGKSKREIFKELGISRGALYQPHVGDEVKRKVIEEAFKRLDSGTITKILYGYMKNLFVNFLIDILCAAGDEINNTEFIREIFTENADLLKSVRDIERKKIIEIVANKLNLTEKEGRS